MTDHRCWEEIEPFFKHKVRQFPDFSWDYDPDDEEDDDEAE